MANLLEILKSTFGVSGQPTSGQEATQMTGFDNAGLSLGETPPGTTGEGTTGTTGGTAVDGGTTGGTTGGGGFVIGGGAQTTGGKKDNKGDGTGTSVTVAGEAGKEKKPPKSEVLGEALVFGGTAYDEGTRARKLQEAIKQRPLTNQDFFPDTQVLRESRTAWGDPIFTGAGQLFPMAVLDAQRKARAEAAAEAEAEAVLRFEPPKINVPALRARFVPEFIDEARTFMSDAVKQYGSYKNAIRAIRQDGSLGKFMNKWNSLADDINITADAATNFVKQQQEKGNENLFFSPSATTAATNFLYGMDKWSKGELSSEQLGQLRSQLKSYESYDSYKDDAVTKYLKDTETIPALQNKVQQEYQKGATDPQMKVEYEAEKVRLQGNVPGYDVWLLTKKIGQVTEEQALTAVVRPFFERNPSAGEQLIKQGETQSDAETRLAREIAVGLGQRIETGLLEKRASASNVFNLGTGGRQVKEGFMKSTVDIVSGIKENLQKAIAQVKSGDVTPDQALEGSFGSSWRALPNDQLMRVGTEGKVWGKTVPRKLSDYSSPVSGGKEFSKMVGEDVMYRYGLVDKNKKPDYSLLPKSATITNVQMGFGVPDGKGGWNILTKEMYKKYGLPPDAKPIVIEENTLSFNDKGQYTQQEELALMEKGLTPEQIQTRNKGLKAFRIYEATPESVKHIDDAGNMATSNEGGIGLPNFSGNITITQPESASVE